MKFALLAIGLIALGGCVMDPDYGYVRPDAGYAYYPDGAYGSDYYGDGYYGACGSCGSVSIGVGYGYGGYPTYGYPAYDYGGYPGYGYGGYPYGGYTVYGGYPYGYYGHSHGHHDHDHHGHDHHDYDHHDHGDHHDHDEHHGHGGHDDHDWNHHHSGPDNPSPLAWREPEHVPAPYRAELTGRGMLQTPIYRAPAPRLASPARNSGSASPRPARESPHVRPTWAPPAKQTPIR